MKTSLVNQFEKPKSDKIPPRPDNCPCGNKADYFYVEVWEGQNVKRGVYSQFSVLGSNDGLRPDYEFKEWVVTCTSCHSTDWRDELMNTAVKEGVKVALEKHTTPAKPKEAPEPLIDEELLVKCDRRDKEEKEPLTQDELNQILEDAKAAHNTREL